MKQVIFYYDFASPFAYLGSTQIERIAAAAGAAIEWRPILLGGLFRAIGTPDVPLLAMSEPRRRYLLRDLRQWAAFWDVPLTWPTRFPMNTIAALRLALAAESSIAPLSHALFHAYWAADRDLSDPAALAAVANSVGLDGASLVATATDPAKTNSLRLRLRDATAEAERDGVFGVPTFRVGDQLFWGQDRLDFVAAALRDL